MKFYQVSDRYINFLKTIDPKVPHHSGANYQFSKPFIGIVFSINEVSFIAPLTSYKVKQDKIATSAITAFKLYNRRNKNEKLGMVQLNNMIPVIYSEISLIDFKEQGQKYRRLLEKQYEYISNNTVSILDKSQRLYEHVSGNTNPDDFICNISCDFVKLLREHKKFLQIGDGNS